MKVLHPCCKDLDNGAQVVEHVQRRCAAAAAVMMKTDAEADVEVAVLDVADPN